MNLAENSPRHSLYRRATASAPISQHPETTAQMCLDVVRLARCQSRKLIMLRRKALEESQQDGFNLVVKPPRERPSPSVILIPFGLSPIGAVVRPDDGAIQSMSAVVSRSTTANFERYSSMAS